MRYISMDQAKPGMIVGKSVFNEEGKILVNYKVCLTEKLIGQMKEKKLQGLYINDELSNVPDGARTYQFTEPLCS